MAQLREDYNQFVNRHSEIIVVGPETPTSFKAHWQKHRLPFVGLPDPTHTVLKWYGQQVKIFKLGRMPAQVIMDREGCVQFAHYGHSMRDIPASAEIIALIDWRIEVVKDNCLKIRRSPVIIPALQGKLIEEYFGLASTNDETISIAHMIAQPGWMEPFQQPTFDEYIIMISGKQTVTVDDHDVAISAGETLKVNKHCRVRYANPFEKPPSTGRFAFRHSHRKWFTGTMKRCSSGSVMKDADERCCPTCLYTERIHHQIA